MLKYLRVKAHDLCNLLSNGSEKMCVCVCACETEAGREGEQMRQDVNLLNLSEGYLGGLCIIFAAFLEVL